MILVTGATGHVGQQVVRTLRKLGADVRALVRSGSEYYWLNDTGCKYFFGDLRKPDSIARALQGCEHVVVCSGVALQTRDNNHQTVTVDGHRALFEGAAEHGVRRVVLLSCMGIDLPVVGFHARKQAEEALHASEVEHTILRASVHEQLFVDLAWRVHDRGRVTLLGPGTNRLSPITRRDLALVLAASLDSEATKNATLDVGGLQQMTALEALAIACQAVGVDPRTRVIPAPIAQMSTHLGSPVRRYAHRAAELRAWFSQDFAVDAERMKATFRIPWSDFAQGARQTVELTAILRDPERREKMMVHPQFYATVYQPGTIDVDALPAGPSRGS